MSDNKSISEEESGDPGRTPGSAEGDRETVEKDLKEKDLENDSESNENNTFESTSGENQ